MTRQCQTLKQFAICRWFRVFVLLGCVTAFQSGPALAQGPATLDEILKAHNAWSNPPLSVVMTGTSTKGKVTVPFKITATREEETLTEYGDRKQVATSKRNFHDDGEKITYSTNLPGYSQLDVTGLFFIVQLQQKAARLELPQPVTVKGAPAYRIRASNNRSQIHFGMTKVQDELDIYVTGNGLLAAISRLLYDDQPFRHTQSYVFSDYKEHNKVLLPYRVEVFLKSRLVETIQVENYQFDIPATPSLFQPRRITR